MTAKEQQMYEASHTQGVYATGRQIIFVRDQWEQKKRKNISDST